MKKYNTLFSLIIFFIIAFMFISPERFIIGAFNGISVWAVNVLPAVLPFMIFSKLLTSLGMVERLSDNLKSFMQKIFGTSGISAYAFTLSIMSGYPVGAKLTADLYQSGKITKGDAFRMTSFCSNSGPMFILGTVGVGMLLSKEAGYVILVSHILGAILNGICWKKIKVHDSEKKLFNDLEKSSSNFSDMIINSVLSILSVGAIIMMFFIVIEAVSPLLNFLPDKIHGVLNGLIEMTHGCLDVSKTMPIKFATMACTFLISFGGISTCIQSTTLLSKLEIKTSTFMMQKLTHGILGLLISVPLCFMLL